MSSVINSAQPFKVAMIVAMTPDNHIGKDNQLLWHIPADLKYFKQTTLGKPVIMGRKTFESIGRPLPGRKNIVLSRADTQIHPDVTMASSIESALIAAETGLDASQTTNEIMIIGGGYIYDLYLPLADTLYVTEVNTEIKGDTQFPQINLQEWQLTAEQAGILDEKNKLPHRFLTYQRKVND